MALSVQTISEENRIREHLDRLAEARKCVPVATSQVIVDIDFTGDFVYYHCSIKRASFAGRQPVERQDKVPELPKLDAAGMIPQMKKGRQQR